MPYKRFTHFSFHGLWNYIFMAPEETSINDLIFIGTIQNRLRLSSQHTRQSQHAAQSPNTNRVCRPMLSANDTLIVPATRHLLCDYNNGHSYLIHRQNSCCIRYSNKWISNRSLWFVIDINILYFDCSAKWNVEYTYAWIYLKLNIKRILPI